MIFVDTSVWVAALRSGSGREGTHLKELLDRDAVALAVIVRLEILMGANARDRVTLRRALSGLPVHAPGTQTWERIEEWIDVASPAGHTFGIADLLVAALAHEQDAELWSLDQDFERMARLDLVRAYEPG